MKQRTNLDLAFGNASTKSTGNDAFNLLKVFKRIPWFSNHNAVNKVQ